MSYDDYGYGYGSSGVSSGLALFAGIGIFMYIIAIAASILLLVSMWKVFKKFGKPGWAAIIPIYNIYIMCEIAEKEWWYILLLCVPIANIYAMYVLYSAIANKLGKSTGFVIGMILVPYVFWPILAFSKSEVAVAQETPSQQMPMQSNDSFANVNNGFNNQVNPAPFNAQPVNGPVMQNAFNNPLPSESVQSNDSFANVTGDTQIYPNSNNFNDNQNGIM